MENNNDSRMIMLMKKHYGNNTLEFLQNENFESKSILCHLKPGSLALTPSKRTTG